MYPQILIAYGIQTTYLLVLLLIFWWLLVFLCSDGETHFNGLTKENDATYGDKVFNRFYFSTVTMTTLGYGDISPKSKTARGITLVFMLLMFFGLLSILDKYIMLKKAT